MLDAERIKEQASIARIIGGYLELRKAGGHNLEGLCPFHSEKTPSFKVEIGKGFFKCFGCGAGGDVFDFVGKIEGLDFGGAVKRVAELAGVPDLAAERPQAASNGRMREKTPAGSIVAVYRYTTAEGEPLYEVCRREPGEDGKSKNFFQRYWEGGREIKQKHQYQVLYRLPEVAAADTVYLVEGEKDADTLAGHGLVATTNAGGANAKWERQFNEMLSGKEVILMPDQDPPGLKRGEAIEKALRSHVRLLLVVHLPGAKDATDYLASHTLEEFLALVEEARAAARIEAMAARGLLAPTEILELSGGYGLFCDPSKRPRGLLTGISRLDEMTLGLMPGQLTILAARPSMGKTALALNVAQRAAALGPVPIFSLEMSGEELLARAVCSEARIDMTKYRAGYLSLDERGRFRRSLDYVCSLPLLIDDASDMDLERMDALIERTDGVRLVVVDHINLMGTRRRKENRTQEVSSISRGLKLIAKKFRIPVLALCQLNRSPESRPGDHRPQLGDLRESGSIEQDADMVWLLYREEYYKQDREELRGLAEIIIAKQRNGPVGRVKCLFMRECVRFDNLYEDAT